MVIVRGAGPGDPSAKPQPNSLSREQLYEGFRCVEDIYRARGGSNYRDLVEWMYRYGRDLFDMAQDSLENFDTKKSLQAQIDDMEEEILRLEDLVAST
jgi:hypothetical protein